MPVQLIFGRQTLQNDQWPLTFLTGLMGSSSQHDPEPMVVGGSFTNWKITRSVAPGSGVILTWTLYKNGVATSAVITISGASDTEGSYTGTVSYAAGDTIHCQAGRNLLDTVAVTRSSIEWIPDNGVSQIYGWSGQASSGADGVGLAMSGNVGFSAAGLFEYSGLVGTAGTITAHRAKVRTAPGAGKSRVFTLVKNGVDQDGSGGTPNTTATVADANVAATATFSLSVAAGDTLAVRQTGVNTPAAITWSGGSIAFTPTDPDIFITTLTGAGADNSGLVRFAWPNDHANNWSGTTASDRTFIGGLSSSVYAHGILAQLAAAPGAGKSWTFTLYINGVATAVTITVAETDTIGSMSITPPLEIGPGDTWTIAAFATGTPSSTSADQRISLGLGSAAPVEVTFENDQTEIGLHWVEHITKDDVTHVWSKYMLPDPASYYGGEKLDKVTEWKSVRRSLSDRRGQYVGVVYGYVLADDDHALRTIAADDVTQYLINNPTVVRSIPDEDRRALLIPRTIVRGVVREIQPLSPLLFGVTCEDWLSKRFRLGNNERQIPPRLIKDDIPTAPDASLELGVPIIYGALSDQSSQTTQIGTALPYDSSIAAITSVGCHDVSGGTIPAGRVTAIVTGVLAGEEGPVSNAAGTNHTSAPRTVRVGWNSNSFTYDSYRIYLFEGMLGDWTPHGGVRSGVTVEWVRMLTHNTTPGGGDWGSGTWKEFGVDFTSLTDGTDALTGVLSTTVDQGHGVVAPIYVGVEEVSGTNYHKFVVAGHACQAIDELYVDGVAQNIATDSSQAGAGGIWLIPGYAGWTAEFGATVYELINGRRYTVIYGKAGQYGPDRGSGDVPNTEAGFDPSLVAPLTLNLKGIEETGDGTGTLITKVIDQMYHFAVNYVAQDYAGLDWASVPTFADDATLPLVDLASFNAADAIGDTQISGGIVGAGMFADPITLREAFARLAVSTGIRYGFNRKTQLAAFKLSDDPDLTVAPHYTQELDILKDSFHLRTVQDDWANEVPYAFGRNHALQKWGTESTIADSESIANFGETKVLEQQEYWFLHDAAIASDVASRELIWRRIPPNVVTLETALRGLNDDHGDYIRITHTSGLGATGWTEQPTWIVRHEVDPDRNKVWLELEDIARYVGSPELGGGAAVMGDEATMAETWLTATDADKAFAYMADATTGQFTDGALGKELR